MRSVADDNYSEVLSDVQRASTLSPTDEISAMAATTIRPAIRAYSITSPPCSSRTNLFRSVFMTMAPYEDPQFAFVPATCRSADRAVLACTTQPASLAACSLAIGAHDLLL